MKIVVILGTRPEAIKMAPVIMELKAAAGLDVRVAATGQHRQMLDQALGIFGIVPDQDLKVMKRNQGLPDLTALLTRRLWAFPMKSGVRSPWPVWSRHQEPI